MECKRIHRDRYLNDPTRRHNWQHSADFDRIGFRFGSLINADGFCKHDIHMVVLGAKQRWVAGSFPRVECDCRIINR